MNYCLEYWCKPAGRGTERVWARGRINIYASPGISGPLLSPPKLISCREKIALIFCLHSVFEHSRPQVHRTFPLAPSSKEPLPQYLIGPGRTLPKAINIYIYIYIGANPLSCLRPPLYTQSKALKGRPRRTLFFPLRSQRIPKSSDA